MIRCNGFQNLNTCNRFRPTLNFRKKKKKKQPHDVEMFNTFADFCVGKNTNNI